MDFIDGLASRIQQFDTTLASGRSNAGGRVLGPLSFVLSVRIPQEGIENGDPASILIGAVNCAGETV
jgi:hypothetical protein